LFESTLKGLVLEYNLGLVVVLNLERDKNNMHYRGLRLDGGISLEEFWSEIKAVSGLFPLLSLMQE